MSLYVVDDFYSQPDLVRELALKAQYVDVSKLNYPGFQSRHSYSSANLVQRFSTILSQELVTCPKRHTFGKFRIMLKETASQLKVHLDGHADWTGLIYLTPNDFAIGGTGFYRHRETGLLSSLSDQEAQERGYQDWQALEKALIEKDSLNPLAWEMVDYVAMKFNRLVLFKGNKRFHCHTHSFGTCLADGRLTQNFFFDQAMG